MTMDHLTVRSCVRKTFVAFAVMGLLFLNLAPGGAKEVSNARALCANFVEVKATIEVPGNPWVSLAVMVETAQEKALSFGYEVTTSSESLPVMDWMGESGDIGARMDFFRNPTYAPIVVRSGMIYFPGGRTCQFLDTMMVYPVPSTEQASRKGFTSTRRTMRDELHTHRGQL